MIPVEVKETPYPIKYFDPVVPKPTDVRGSKYVVLFSLITKSVLIFGTLYEKLLGFKVTASPTECATPTVPSYALCTLYELSTVFIFKINNFSAPTTIVSSVRSLPEVADSDKVIVVTIPV